MQEIVYIVCSCNKFYAVNQIDMQHTSISKVKSRSFDPRDLFGLLVQGKRHVSSKKYGNAFKREDEKDVLDMKSRQALRDIKHLLGNMSYIHFFV